MSKPNKILIYTGLLLIVLSFPAVYFGITNIRKAHITTFWPSTKGYITESILVTQDKTGAAMYSPKIIYQYMVHSMPLTADSLRIKPVKSQHKREIQEILDHYPKGKYIDVYYNPKAPKIALLEPGSSNSGNMLFALGLLLCVCGTSILMVQIKVKP